jgi:hypothetical protein
MYHSREDNLEALEEWLKYEYKFWKRRKKKPMALERRRTTVLNRRNAFEASILNSPRDVVLFQTVKRITPRGFVKLSKIYPS